MLSCPTVLILYTVWLRTQIKTCNALTGFNAIVKTKIPTKARSTTVRVVPKTGGINFNMVRVINATKRIKINTKVFGNMSVTINLFILFIVCIRSSI
jgi:hypothetical protein